MVDKQLEAHLDSTVSSFKEVTSEFMKNILSAHEEHLSAKHRSELNSLQDIIEAQSEDLEHLRKELEKYQHRSTQALKWAFMTFNRETDSKVLQSALQTWISFTKSTNRIIHLKDYVYVHFSRNMEKKVFSAWKYEAHGKARINHNRRYQARLNLEIADANKQANEEIALLKAQVEDLTEDLRNESLGKNHLEYEYEQALLRGMSALSIENMSIEQNLMEHYRGLSETSKQLLYSTDTPMFKTQ